MDCDQILAPLPGSNIDCLFCRAIRLDDRCDLFRRTMRLDDHCVGVGAVY